MKLRDKLTKKQKEYLIIFLGSFSSIMVLVMSLFALSHIINGTEESLVYFKNYAFLMFLFMALVRVPMSFTEKNKINLIRNIVVGSIFFVFAILTLFLKVSSTEYCIIGGIFSLTILTNRILKILSNRKSLRNVITNCILAFLAFILAFIFFIASADKEAPLETFVVVLLFIIVAMSLGEVLFFCFSRIKLRTMTKIIRKTYAVEVLYGMFVLIIASSFIFYIFEEDIATYGDALWYSFAVVTTIGFGDLKVTGTISRILSVLLGIYGLIVVAVLTSIIVNFYNETSKKEEENNKKEIEKKEDESSDGEESPEDDNSGEDKIEEEQEDKPEK